MQLPTWTSEVGKVLTGRAGKETQASRLPVSAQGFLLNTVFFKTMAIVNDAGLSTRGRHVFVIPDFPFPPLLLPGLNLYYLRNGLGDCTLTLFNT